MGRTGVTQEQAFAAADALVEEGIQPSVRTIQARTKGSFSTIKPYFDAWREERGAVVAAEIPEIPDKVQGAFGQIWATASRFAQEGLKTQQQALEAVRREMEAEQDAMAEEIERLEAALDEQTSLAQ